MDKQKIKATRRRRRRMGSRKRITGAPARPRLNVYRSLNHIYAQVIDDLAGVTIVSASSREADLGLGSTGNAEAAKKVGERIAQRAKEKGVERVVFDRGGFRYHGRVKALAEAARSGGLQF